MSRPSWTLPERNKDFVRALGGVKATEDVGMVSNGLSGWIMEPFVCDAKKGPKFHDLPAMALSGGARQWKIENRLLFFDGQSSGRVEYHFKIDLNGIPEPVPFNLINDFLCKLKLKVKKHEGAQNVDYDEVDFGRSGLLHTRALAARTVSQDNFSNLHEIRRFIKYMRPAIVHVVEAGEATEFGKNFVKVRNNVSKYLDVFHDRVRVFSSIDIPVWVIVTKPKVNKRDVRDLALYLRRMHSEYECLKVLLRAIERGIIPTVDDFLPENFEVYLREVLKRVRTAEAKFERSSSFAPEQQEELPKIVDLASVSIHDLDPTLHEQIRNALRQAKFKWTSNQNQISNFLKTLESRSATVNFNVRELNMDNSQNVSNSSGVVLAQAGRDAQVKIDKSFNGFQDNTSNTELVQAVAELKELIDQAIEAGEVEKPEIAARDFEELALESASEEPRKEKVEMNGKMIVGAIKESSSLITAVSKAIETIGSFF